MSPAGRAAASCLLRLLCVCGFVWQVYNVAQSFFSYKTTSKVMLSTQDPPVLPSLQLCLRYTDILDLETLNHQLGTKFKRTNDLEEVNALQANLSIRQILENVPSASETIASCSHRNPDGLLMQLENKAGCLQYFNVSRFYIQSFVCYTFQFLGPIHLSAKQVANSLHHPNSLYGVILNKNFSGMDMIYVTVAHFGKIATRSMPYSVLINRLSNFETREVRNNIYVFGYSLYRVQLLEPPYDTQCHHKNEEQDMGCLSQCFEDMEKHLDRISFSTIVSEPIDAKHVNHYDLRDERRAAIVKDFVDRCYDQCDDELTCNYNFTVTYYDLSQRIPGSSEFRAVARTPKAPGLDVRFEPKLSLMEFVIYVCSCIGIWFGLSVVSVNPFEAILKKKIPMTTKQLKQKLLPCKKAAATNNRTKRRV